ncbi:hypothetical protein GPJ56_002462 [Histomonas meleagridis]|uniref:uncharacterized protein n=1 Tax=Histomonas meleagridis TaxID=135588 RepID=UPI0035595B71|nr:hypothetical protein GPJ56_002462 [Histomonas meleagridis]KAH0798253.1 hypothetical protein GO595_008941 [Histomonas meleagridis]
MMEEEEEMGEVVPSLFGDFPDINENSLSCLTPLPVCDESTTYLFKDLFDKPSNDPLVPSLLSQDPFLKNVAQVRSIIAQIGLLQFGGGFNIESYSKTLVKCIDKFFDCYPSFCAVMIQRFWRAKKYGKKSDKIKFGMAMIVRPSNGRNEADRQIRKQLINDILSIQFE